MLRIYFLVSLLKFYQKIGKLYQNENLNWSAWVGWAILDEKYSYFPDFLIKFD